MRGFYQNQNSLAFERMTLLTAAFDRSINHRLLANFVESAFDQVHHNPHRVKEAYFSVPFVAVEGIYLGDETLVLNIRNELIPITFERLRNVDVAVIYVDIGQSPSGKTVTLVKPLDISNNKCQLRVGSQGHPAVTVEFSVKQCDALSFGVKTDQ